MRRISLALLTVLACNPAKPSASVGPEPETASAHDVDTTAAPSLPRALAWTNAAELKSYCAQAVQEHDQRLAELSREATPEAGRAWFERLDELLSLVSARGSTTLVLSLIHPDGELRAATFACGAQMQSFQPRAVSDPRVRAVLERLRRDTTDSDERVALDVLIPKYKGHFGTAHGHPSTAKLHGQIERSKVEYRVNVTEHAELVIAKATELSGLPEDFLQSFLDPKTGEAKIPPQFGVLQTVLAFADSEALRKRMWMAQNSKGYPANVAVLKRQLEASAELAKAYQAPDWPTHLLASNMVSSPSQLEDFLKQSHEILAPVAANEYAQLLARKRVDHPKARRVEPWDRDYYLRLVRDEKFGVSEKAMRPYLDSLSVEEGMLAFFGEHLSLEFRPFKSDLPWPDSVRSYEVIDQGKVWTRIHFDTQARPGKLKIAATMPIVGEDSSPHNPDYVVMYSFPEPDPKTGLSVLNWDQATLLFHEFGHFLSDVYGTRGRFSVQREVISRDYLEFPSTFNELWLNDFRVGVTALRHHKTRQPIDRATFDAWIKARAFGLGMMHVERMAETSYALKVYQQDPNEIVPDRLYRELVAKFTPFRLPDDARTPYSRILFPIYEAGYYTYFWSQVVARDTWERVHGNGNSIGEAVRQFRDGLLLRAYTMDSRTLLSSFLGHPPSTVGYRSALAGRSLDRSRSAIAP